MFKQKPKNHITVKRALVLVLPVLFVVVGVVVSLIPQRQAYAATSDTVNFQARLLTSAGNVVPDGYYNVEFKIYNAATSSGSSQGACTGDTTHCLWTETRTGADKVRVANGYLTVNLGSVTAFSGTMPWDQQFWLTMNIGGTGSPSWDGEMTPRLKLTATPYSFASGKVVSADGTGSATVANGDLGTICIQNSANCGFIKNQTNALQTATTNLKIQGSVTSEVALAVKAASGQTADIFQVQASNGAALLSVGAASSAINNNLVVNGSGSASNQTLIVKGNNSMGGPDTIFEVQSYSGASAFRVTNGADVGIGNASGLAGKLAISSGAYFGEIKATNLTIYNSYELPNETGTICLQGKSSCGFVLPSTNDFIKNQQAVAQQAGIWAQGTNTSNVSFVFQSPTSSSQDIMHVYNAANTAGVAITANGALSFLGNGTVNMTTPVGSSVPTKIKVDPFDPGSFGQILALGLTASAQSSSRAISLFDARTGPHQPTISVFNPGESEVFGLSWDGSSSVAALKSTASTIVIRTGNGTDAAEYTTTGINLNLNTAVASGKTLTVLGTLQGSTIDAGSSGQIMNIGTTNALGINLNQNTAVASGKLFTVLGTLQSSTIDAGSSGQAMNIGGSNATVINLKQNVSVDAGKNLTLAGGSLAITGQAAGTNALSVQGAASGTTPVMLLRGGATPGGAADLLQVQNSSATSLFSVNKDGLVTASNGFSMAYNATATFAIQGASSTFVTVDPANSKFYIGSAADCVGRFCVSQIVTGVGGSTYTNGYNYLKGSSSINTTSSFIGQDVIVEDDSTVSSGTRNTNRGIRVDFTASGNAYSNYYGLQIKISSTTSTTSYGGNAIQIDNGAVSTFVISNVGSATFQNTLNSTSAFRIINSGSTTVLNVDTSGNRFTFNGGVSGDSTTPFASIFEIKNFSGVRASSMTNYGALTLNTSVTSGTDNNTTPGIIFNNSNASCVDTWFCLSIRKYPSLNALYFSAVDGYRFWTGSGTNTPALRIDSAGKVAVGPDQADTLSETFSVIGGTFSVRNHSAQVLRISTDSVNGYTRLDSATAGMVLATWDQTNFAGGELIHLYLDQAGTMWIESPNLEIESTTTQFEGANIFMNAIPTASTGTSARTLCLASTSSKKVVYGPSATTCSSSSARFKHDIQTMDDSMGLEALLGLRPVTFAYNGGDGSQQVGLIAEEVAQVLPQVVAYDEDGQASGINYEFMVANLIKGIQQQQVQINNIQQGIWNGGLVSNDTTFNGYVTFNSSVKFVGDAEFDGRATFNGAVAFNENTSGTIVLPHGDTEVAVQFTQPYNAVPNISISSSDFAEIKVQNKTIDGFTIVIKNALSHDINIDWIALQVGSQVQAP